MNLMGEGMLDKKERNNFLASPPLNLASIAKQAAKEWNLYVPKQVSRFSGEISVHHNWLFPRATEI